MGGPAGLRQSVTPAAAAEGWASTGSMAVARYLHTATLLPDGHVLVAGGTGSDEQATACTEVYDPTTGGWSSGDSMGVAREDHTATLLASGKVLSSVAYTGLRQRLRRARSCTTRPRARGRAPGRWPSTGSSTRRPLLPNGKVLVTGGADAEAATAMASAATRYDTFARPMVDDRQQGALPRPARPSG